MTGGGVLCDQHAGDKAAAQLAIDGAVNIVEC
jgi:hypothetical protein